MYRQPRSACALGALLVSRQLQCIYSHAVHVFSGRCSCQGSFNVSTATQSMRARGALLVLGQLQSIYSLAVHVHSGRCSSQRSFNLSTASQCMRTRGAARVREASIYLQPRSACALGALLISGSYIHIRACYSHARTVPKPVGTALNILAFAANTLRALLTHTATLIRACYSHARTVPKPVGTALNHDLAANTLRALLAHTATFIRASYSHARTVPKPVGMALNRGPRSQHAQGAARSRSYIHTHLLLSCSHSAKASRHST